MRLVSLLLMVPVLALAADSKPVSLDWLEGCWVSQDGGSHEVWVIEDDESLIGFSISQDGARLAFYELLSIRRDDNGAWRYNAHPSGQASTTFVATEHTEQSVTFSNPDHDYPQEISYRRDDAVLYASISLLGGEKPRSFNKRACE